MIDLIEKTKTGLKLGKVKALGLINYKLAIIVLTFVLIPNTHVYAGEFGLEMFDTLIDIILSMLTYAGVVVIIVSAVKLFESFQTDNPAGKTQGFMGMIGGVAIASMGVIIDALGIL